MRQPCPYIKRKPFVCLRTILLPIGLFDYCKEEDAKRSNPPVANIYLLLADHLLL